MNQKFGSLDGSEDLSKLAEDLYKYHLNQKNDKTILRENNFLNNNFNNYNKINNINKINTEDEKEINLINKSINNNKREKIIEINNNKSRNNNINENQQINEKINYYRNYNKLEKLDYRSDIHTNYFDQFLKYKSFKFAKNNDNNLYDEKDELNEDSIKIVDNNEEKKDKDDNIIFKNNFNSSLNSPLKRNIISKDKNESENENELISKEDSKSSNHISDIDNEQDKDNLDSREKSLNSLENESIRASNEEGIRENQNENLENQNHFYIMMRRVFLLRFFGFYQYIFENLFRNNNQLNDSSFESFDNNDYTIYGSTQLSIQESNNNSNAQYENISSNSNEEKNLSQELLICSEEKTEDKK